MQHGLLKVCMYNSLYVQSQKGPLQSQIFNFKVLAVGGSLRALFCGCFVGVFLRGICKQVHEGLCSETCVEMWKERVGEQRKQNSSFPCLFIDFACVSNFCLHLLYELV